MIANEAGKSKQVAMGSTSGNLTLKGDIQPET
jgi:hypothetical protein